EPGGPDRGRLGMRVQGGQRRVAVRQQRDPPLPRGLQGDRRDPGRAGPDDRRQAARALPQGTDRTRHRLAGRRAAVQPERHLPGGSPRLSGRSRVGAGVLAVDPRGPTRTHECGLAQWGAARPEPWPAAPTALPDRWLSWARWPLTEAFLPKQPPSRSSLTPWSSESWRPWTSYGRSSDYSARSGGSRTWR